MLRSRSAIFERLNIESFYNTFVSMPPRQQLITLAACVVVLFMIVVLPISLASSHLSGLEEQIQSSKNQIDEIVREIGSFNRLNSEFSQLNNVMRKGQDGSISSTIENLAQSVDIKGNVDAIKERPVAPSDLYDEITVDVTVSKITLKQLTDFLYSIENSDSQLMRVKKLQVKTRHDSRSQVNATFSVSSYRLTGEG